VQARREHLVVRAARFTRLRTTSCSGSEDEPPFLGGALPTGQREHSEATAREIDIAVREIIDAVYAKTSPS
jgi:ATP-dependent Zn protease